MAFVVIPLGPLQPATALGPNLQTADITTTHYYFEQ